MQDLRARAGSRPIKAFMGATLILLAKPAHAPMVQMELPRLKDRINAVYGYNAIARITLTQTANEPGRYIGQLTDKVEGRRFVELLGVQDGKTWRMFEEEQVSHDKDLLLGDEPLQGAEDLKK